MSPVPTQPELAVQSSHGAQSSPGVRAPRIIFYEAYPGFRGAQRSLSVLARGVSNQGFGVEIWCGAEGRARSGFERAGLTTLSVVPARGALRRFGGRWRGLGLPLAWCRHVVDLARRLRRARPALVHCNQLRGLLLIGPAARSLGIPVVWHQRGALERNGAFARLGQRLAHRVVCVSQGVRSTLPDPDSSRVVVVHNGLEPAPSGSTGTPEPQRRLAELAEKRGIEHPFVLLTASALTPYKGLHHVAAALEALDRRGSELAQRTLWLILGDAEAVDRQRRYREFLDHRIRSLGLADRVVWLGWQDDPRPWMASVDLVLLPTVERERLQFTDGTTVEAVCSEGLSRTVLEAMAEGAPVVASSVTGVDEQIDSGVDGWIVPPGDPIALADTIERLAQDPVTTRRVAETARSTSQRFSAEAMTRAIVDLYRQLIPPPPSPERE